MRRSFPVILSIGAVLLIGGCASNSQNTAHGPSHNVSLAGGDTVGRMLHRDAPSLTIVSTTPSTTSPRFATVPTDAGER